MGFVVSWSRLKSESLIYIVNHTTTLLTNVVVSATLVVTMQEGTVQVGFRFPARLVERIDAYAMEMSKRFPGIKIGRADAVRTLLEQALAAAAAPSKAGKRPKRGTR